MNSETLFILFNDIDDELVKEAAHDTYRKDPSLLRRSLTAAAVISILITCLLYYHTSKQGDHTYYTDHYNVVVKNGNYAICDVDVPQSEPSSSLDDIQVRMLADMYVYFDSISEMKSDILSGTFSDDELRAIGRMRRDSSGTITIPDLSELYEPTFPSTFKGYRVRWSGDEYIFSMLTDDDIDYDIEQYSIKNNKMIEFYRACATMRLCTEDHYRSTLDYFIDYEQKKQCRITDIVYDPERAATEYYLVQPVCKVVIYEIQTPNKTLHIKETYSNMNSDTPNNIEFCGIEDGVCFTGQIKHVNSWMERPSIEWLSGFGITKHTSS